MGINKVMRILVTGARGFVGRHLINTLAQSEVEVWGVDRIASDDTDNDLRHFQSDLGDIERLTRVIKQVQPTHIFHLAGLLGNAPYEDLYKVNVLGTIHLLEVLRSTTCDARVLVASSSGVYGATLPEQNPLDESCPPRPISHYGASKLAQETVGLQYHRAYQMPILITRTFNLLGPGLSPALLASSLARQLVQIELNQSNGPILVGNLWPHRDYIDVRDAVNAYISLMTAGEPGLAYNVCTGRSYSVQDCLDTLLDLTQRPVEVQQDPGRMRNEEIADQIGDSSRLRAATSWQVTIPFEQSLADLLNQWRTDLTKGGVH